MERQCELMQGNTAHFKSAVKGDRNKGRAIRSAKQKIEHVWKRRMHQKGQGQDTGTGKGKDTKRDGKENSQDKGRGKGKSRRGRGNASLCLSHIRNNAVVKCKRQCGR